LRAELGVRFGPDQAMTAVVEGVDITPEEAIFLLTCCWYNRMEGENYLPCQFPSSASVENVIAQLRAIVPTFDPDRCAAEIDRKVNDAIRREELAASRKTNG